MARQFVGVKFKPTDAREYTYHHDGEPVAVGDTVIVETKDGEVSVSVTSLFDFAPPFNTKPIKGKALV